MLSHNQTHFPLFTVPRAKVDQLCACDVLWGYDNNNSNNFFPTFPLAQDKIQIAPPTSTTATSFFSDTPPRHTTHPFTTSTHFHPTVWCVLLWSTHTHTHSHGKWPLYSFSPTLALARSLSLFLRLGGAQVPLLDSRQMKNPSLGRRRFRNRPNPSSSRIPLFLRFSSQCTHDYRDDVKLFLLLRFFVPKIRDKIRWKTVTGDTHTAAAARIFRRTDVDRFEDACGEVCPPHLRGHHRAEREREFRPALIFLYLLMMVRERERQRERCSGKLSHVKRRRGDTMFWQNVRWEREREEVERHGVERGKFEFFFGKVRMSSVFYAVWTNQCDCLDGLGDHATPLSAVAF